MLNGMQDLRSLTRDQTSTPPAPLVKVWSLNHWNTMEVPT